MKVEINNVTKKIGNELVLNNINLKFDNGKIYCIIGRNGSGKTILLKSICGFVKPTTGSILADGIDIYKENVFPKNTGATFENPEYLPNLSGYENLKMIAAIQNIITDKDIEKTMKKINLYEEKDKLFKKYSLGNKQKVAIAQAIMENPELLILDEPFNGLDNNTIKNLIDILEVMKKEGKTIIIATHIKDDIEKISDKIYTIQNGEIIKD